MINSYLTELPRIDYKGEWIVFSKHGGGKSVFLHTEE